MTTTPKRGEVVMKSHQRFALALALRPRQFLAEKREREQISFVEFVTLACFMPWFLYKHLRRSGSHVSLRIGFGIPNASHDDIIYIYIYIYVSDYMI